MYNMKYEFKHIKLPDEHSFDDDHLAFLETIDKAFVQAIEKSINKEDLETAKTELQEKLDEHKNSFKYDEIMEHINAAFKEMEKIRAEKPTIDKEEKEAKERSLNNKWIRAFLHKDREGIKAVEKEMKELEQKTELEPVLHTGAGSDMLSTDQSQGAYLIPELLLAEVNRFVISGGVARREMRYLPFSGAGNSRYIPTLLTNVTVDWIGEGEAKPKTKPVTSRVEQTLETVAAMVIMTEEILEDSIVDLTSLCGQLLGEAIAAEEDNQFFAGVGAPWTGIINNPNVVGLALAATVGPIDMRPESLLAMTVAIPEGAVPGSKFYMNRQVWAALCARRSDAVAAGDSRGVFLVQTPGESSPGQIWGFPVVLTESMPSVADLYDVEDINDFEPGDDDVENDEPFIIFGNLQKCCVYGDKQGIRVKLLDQASVYDENNELINLAEQDMYALRVHKRVGYVCVLPTGICVLSTGAAS